MNQRVEGHTPTVKPCPFCGESCTQGDTDSMQHPRSNFFDSPSNCPMNGLRFVISQWNKRPEKTRISLKIATSYAEADADCPNCSAALHIEI